ncbi:MAG: hypothetical protein ACOVOD_01715 [Rhodoferax sp.]
MTMQSRPMRSPAPKPAKQCEYTPRPRTPALRRDDGKARMTVPVPKTAYVRDERLRDMCRAMPCQHCGALGPGAGVTWAHSNWAEHGKGKGIKASDVYVAALCSVCHAELDQGRAWSAEEKKRNWLCAHHRTVAKAVIDGTWPEGVELPFFGAAKTRETLKGSTL